MLLLSNYIFHPDPQTRMGIQVMDKLIDFKSMFKEVIHKNVLI